MQEQLDEPAARARVETVLRHLASNHKSLPRRLVRRATFAAYYALGLACYNERRTRSAQQYFSKAFQSDPLMVLDRSTCQAPLKSFLPAGLLDTARRLRQSCA